MPRGWGHRLGHKDLGNSALQGHVLTCWQQPWYTLTPHIILARQKQRTQKSLEERYRTRGDLR